MKNAEVDLEGVNDGAMDGIFDDDLSDDALLEGR